LPFLLAAALACAAPPAVDRDGARTPAPGEVAALLLESDALYREPRTPERVERSFEAALAARAGNDEEALWRAARASFWLSRRHPQAEVQIAFSRKGVALGEEDVASRTSAAPRPEPYFFLALNLGRLSELTGGGLLRIARMKELAAEVVRIDERFAHAGGHRFLGILTHRTSAVPLFAAGTPDDARRHLERACEIAPDYPENHSALAEVLLTFAEPAAARAALERALASPPPPDHAEDHREWTARARELLGEIERGERGEREG
jgi:tetratricopeptide (TPR) repeat protein